MEKLSATYTEEKDEVLIYVYRKEVAKPKKEKIFAKEVEATVFVDQLRDGEIVGVEVLFHTKR